MFSSDGPLLSTDGSVFSSTGPVFSSDETMLSSDGSVVLSSGPLLSTDGPVFSSAGLLLSFDEPLLCSGRPLQSVQAPSGWAYPWTRASSFVHDARRRGSARLAPLLQVLRHPTGLNARRAKLTAARQPHHFEL
ncbi:MAG: hypothetical protein AB3X44_01535 [Leptothrix sp. (in: b-proteobacteria)]